MLPCTPRHMDFHCIRNLGFKSEEKPTYFYEVKFSLIRDGLSGVCKSSYYNKSECEFTFSGIEGLRVILLIFRSIQGKDGCEYCTVNKSRLQGVDCL